MEKESIKQVCTSLFGEDEITFKNIKEKKSRKGNTTINVMTESNTCNGMIFIDISKDNQEHLYKPDIAFKNADHDFVAKFFKEMNYEFFYELVEHYLKLGYKYKFFKKVTFNERLNVADIYKFDKPVARSGRTFLGKVDLAKAIEEKNTDNGHIIATKYIAAYVNYDIINNEIHPVLEISFPYSPKKKFDIKIDLHPSTKINYHTVVNLFKEQFEQSLITHTDTVLKRHFKFKKEDLNKLTIKEKIDYIQIVEMQII